MYERLSVRERRITATLGCVLYLTLVGYKTAVPYSTVSLSSSPPTCFIFGRAKLIA